MPAGQISIDDYQRLLLDICTDLTKMKEQCEKYGLAENAAILNERIVSVKEHRFRVVVIGEFKRGKSMLIDALLGEEICPTNPSPATAVINRIVYGVAPRVQLHMKDGSCAEIPVNALSDHITKLDEESEKRSSMVREAVVAYPLEFCRNNVEIIDTPGLNDDIAMTEITLSALPLADAAIFVILASSPVSETERDFLTNKVLNCDLSHILFVANRIDSLHPDDVEKQLKYISDRLGDCIAQKQGLPGKDDLKTKPEVIGFSAKQALKARLKNDADMLERSRYPLLYGALEKLLMRDRALIMLTNCVGAALSATNSLAAAAGTLKQALTLDADSLRKKAGESEQALQEIRARLIAEMKRIDQDQSAAFAKLNLSRVDFQQEMVRRIGVMIAGEPISSSDLMPGNNPATMERLSKRLRELIVNGFTEFSNNVSDMMEGELGCQVRFLEDLDGQLQSQLAVAQQTLLPAPIDHPSRSGSSQMGVILACGVGVLAALNVVPLLIGLSGVALAYFKTDLFKNNGSKNDAGQVDNFRQQWKQNAVQELNRMWAECDIEDKLSQYVAQGYTGIKARIREEYDGQVKDALHTLETVRQMVIENEATRGLMEKELEEVIITAGMYHEKYDEISMQLETEKR